MKTAKQTIPKYMQIMNYIQQKIQNNEYMPGSRIPSESELMEQFKVSRIVVVNSLTRLANNGIITRIPGKGSFVSELHSDAQVINNSDNNLVQSSAKHISFILPGVADHYSIKLAQSVVDAANKADIYCSLFYSLNNIEKEEDLINYISTQNTSGIILYPSNQETYNKKLIVLANAGLPVVLIDRDLPGLGLSCVQTDNKAATQIATSHLIKLGHKKICICSHTPMPTTSISCRVDGFLSEMAENNIMIDPSLILTQLYSKENIKQLEHIIKTKLATSFICLSIYDYKLVSSIINKCGFSSPDDFSIINIDRIGLFDWFGEQPTHILQDSHKMGSCAFELLTEMINTKTLFTKKITIPPILVNGFSTGMIK